MKQFIEEDMNMALKLIKEKIIKYCKGSDDAIIKIIDKIILI